MDSDAWSGSGSGKEVPKPIDLKAIDGNEPLTEQQAVSSESTSGPSANKLSIEQVCSDSEGDSAKETLARMILQVDSSKKTMSVSSQSEESNSDSSEYVEEFMEPVNNELELVEHGIQESMEPPLVHPSAVTRQRPPPVERFNPKENEETPKTVIGLLIDQFKQVILGEPEPPDIPTSSSELFPTSGSEESDVEIYELCKSEIDENSSPSFNSPAENEEKQLFIFNANQNIDVNRESEKEEKKEDNKILKNIGSDDEDDYSENSSLENISVNQNYIYESIEKVYECKDENDANLLEEKDLDCKEEEEEGLIEDSILEYKQDHDETLKEESDLLIVIDEDTICNTLENNTNISDNSLIVEINKEIVKYEEKLANNDQNLASEKNIEITEHVCKDILRNNEDVKTNNEALNKKVDDGNFKTSPNNRIDNITEKTNENVEHETKPSSNLDEEFETIYQENNSLKDEENLVDIISEFLKINSINDKVDNETEILQKSNSESKISSEIDSSLEVLENKVVTDKLVTEEVKDSENPDKEIDNLPETKSQDIDIQDTNFEILCNPDENEETNRIKIENIIVSSPDTCNNSEQPVELKNSNQKQENSLATSNEDLLPSDIKNDNSPIKNEDDLDIILHPLLNKIVDEVDNQKENFSEEISELKSTDIVTSESSIKQIKSRIPVLKDSPKKLKPKRIVKRIIKPSVVKSENKNSNNQPVMESSTTIITDVKVNQENKNEINIEEKKIEVIEKVIESKNTIEDDSKKDLKTSPKEVTKLNEPAQLKEKTIDELNEGEKENEVRRDEYIIFRENKFFGFIEFYLPNQYMFE